jgi:hypothetical protein
MPATMIHASNMTSQEFTRILVLNADYPRFLGWFYRRHPGLENTSYATQMAARNASLFGVADFYSRNFTALGHQAAGIHVNNPWLQSAWAHEHGMAFENPEPPDGARCPAGAHPTLRAMLHPDYSLKKGSYG